MKYKAVAFQLDAMAAVITIIVFCSIILIAGNSVIKEGKISKASGEAAQIGAAISQYKMERDKYPDGIENLTKKEGQYGPWLLKVPTDPWGKAYIYKKYDNGFVVYSCGPDKTDSGSTAEKGIAKNDIGYWGK
jgi:hypothetical protein